MCVCARACVCVCGRGLGVTRANQFCAAHNAICAVRDEILCSQEITKCELNYADKSYINKALIGHYDCTVY